LTLFPDGYMNVYALAKSRQQAHHRVELNSELWNRKGGREISCCYPVGA